MSASAFSPVDLMPYPTYNEGMSNGRKPQGWLHGEIKTPPFSKEARVEAGTLFRRLQEGEMLELPHSGTMPSIGKRCHELRVRDEDHNGRIVYRLDADAILIAEVFRKTTGRTPKPVIDTSQRRLNRDDEAKPKPKKEREGGG
jgi:phage-related protein